ncbi:MAG: flavodoxin family protein [Pseudomonadota bacterium]
MKQVAIPFHSGAGHTERLAQIIVDTMNDRIGFVAHLIRVEPLEQVDWARLQHADAIIFGSPTYMGNVSGPMKSFMDATGEIWLDQPWANKIGAGFTVGTSPSGDKLNSLIQMAVFAAQHGMVWVGQNQVGSKHGDDADARINDGGSWLGLMAQSATDKAVLIPPHDVETARLFAHRVADAVERWAQD